MDNANTLLLILISQRAVMCLPRLPRMMSPTLLVLPVYRVCVYISLMSSGDFGSGGQRRQEPQYKIVCLLFGQYFRISRIMDSNL